MSSWKCLSVFHPDSLKDNRAVQCYLKYVQEQAVDLTSVQALDCLPGNTEPVDEVYVSVTSLSFEEAWELVQQQQQSSSTSLKDIAMHARQANAEKKKGEELKTTITLLERQRDGAPIRWAMVLGKAGAGKTMVARKILSDWRKERHPRFKSFVAVIYIFRRNI